MAQGLIQTMQHADFRTDYPAAHSAADAGGDFAFARFADFAIAEPTWDVPTADLIAIYASLNYSVSAPQLRACMAEGYAAVQANRIAGRLLFPAWAAQSPFLAERYFDYFRGGVDDMALWTADCWTRVVTWLDRGYWAWNDTCVNMGASWRPGPPPGPGDGPDDQYGAPGNDDDSPFPDIRKPRIPVPLPPSDAPPLPVPSSSHNRPASFANPDFLDLNSVRSCLRVAISDDLASSDHSGDLIQSPLVAALTAGPALLAAPWAARILLRCAPGLSGDLQIETRFSTPPAPRTVNALAALAASTNEPGLPPADPQQPEVPGPQHPDNPSRPARPKDRGEPSSWPRWVLRLENVITLVSRLSRAASGQISTVFQRWFGDGCTKVVSGGKGVLALIETAADYAALGAALAVGDFDGDGLPDLVVGAPRHTSPGVPHAGRAYIFYGRDGLPRSGLAESTASAVVELPASDPRTRGARLATSLAVVDLNRDGIDDLALAAPAFGSHANNWTAAYDGRVIVLFGSKTKGIDTNTSNAGLVIDGVVVRGAPPSRNPGKRARKGDSDQFLMLGEALSGLDVDADGFVDLVIGSPSASAVRGTHQVRRLLLEPVARVSHLADALSCDFQRGLLQAFLAASNHSGPLPHTAADWTIAGSQDFSWFGASAALVPLPPQAVLPGTSSSLLVVGSPGYRHNATIARSNGRISGFRIPLRPSTPSNAEISPRPSLVFTLESRVDLANFGAGLVARGDGLLYVAAPAEVRLRHLDPLA
nr:Glycosylphosphatidylinositol specific phospholipase D1 [Polyrhizophydium stewartii]